MTEVQMAEAAASNAPEISVSELSGALKRTIEDRFGFVRVRGEISNYRGPHSSGHAYFCLKDENARIDAVIWKGSFQRMRTKPREGLEIIATGKVSTFPGKSTYQLIIESIEPAGIGALMALFEERRRRLTAEGLFDEARKQLLPFLPERIGVVTSPTGAVIRDILHRIADRFPRHILVWPVRVQGETSAAEVTAAIEGFNLLPEDGPLRRPDLIIVARGGGSLEDLWSFNEETVVRAAASSLLPLISAIGHETDWTLIDYAADLRAPTPTGAAEKAVPVRLELLAGMADLDRRHQAAMLRLLERRSAEMRGLIRALPQGDAIVALPRQRLDRANTGLAGALTRGHDRYRIALARLSHRLAQQSPHAKMARASQRIEALEQRMRRCLEVGLERRQQGLKHAMSRLLTARAMRLRAETEKLKASAKTLDVLAQRQNRSFAMGLSAREARLLSLGQLLQSLGYRQVLARGFALVRDAEEQPLRLASQLQDGAHLNIEFADGWKSAVVGTQIGTQVGPQARETTKRPVEKGSKTTGQGTLF
jgi:exodeoxyribonuclease VII large subunit